MFSFRNKNFYVLAGVLVLLVFYFLYQRDSSPKEVLIPVTIPEGYTEAQTAEAFAVKLPLFSKENFLVLVAGREGYLFPDTYYFYKTDDEADAVRLMTENYEKKLVPLREEIISAGKSEEEIITMASLIEAEAKGDGDRRIIAGILWKRLARGTRLEVDAADETYEKKGLPESPIGNPGLLAIEAAISPQASPYFYYLHDKKGEIHYARTFAEHRENVLKYLK